MRKPTKAELGWKRHRGGKCPVEEGAIVQVRYRDGFLLVYEVVGILLDDRVWSHSKCVDMQSCDIMAYRILE